MITRLAELSEKEEIKKLWEYCFYDTDPYLSWFFDKFNPENTVVAENGGKIAAALQMEPHVIAIKNTEYQVYYLCGVSVAPEFRGKGAGRKILEFADKTAKKRGAVFNMLIPVLEGFYEKCGYEKCFEKLEYSYNPKRLPPKSDAEFTRITKKNIADAFNIYAEFSKDFGCYIKRTQEDMEKYRSLYDLFCGGGYFINGAEGYFFYYIENGVMHIDEAVCLGETAAAGLMKFVYSHHSQITNVIIRTSVSDVLSYALSSVTAECRKIPTVMLRSLGDVQNVRLFTGQIDGASARRMGMPADGTEKLETSFINIL